MRDFIRSGTKPLSLLALAALTACGGGSDGDSSTYNAEIRRTAMGVPHIKADSWAGVGYGSGYAQAEDNLCTMADSFLTYRGERSQYFGGSALLAYSSTIGQPRNIDSDFFHRHVLSADVVGTMADKLLTDPLSAAPVPAYLSDVEAACLPTAGLTAWRALVTDGNVRPGDVVLVQGTGGVALFALQFAKLLGAYAIVLSSSDDKLARAQALGADEVLNYTKEPAWGRTVKAMAQRLTGRDGVDHVVELGGTSTLEQSLRAVRAGGTLSMIGVLGGAKLEAPLGLVVTRAVRLQGVTVGSRDDFVAMCTAMARTQLRPVVDSVYPFEALTDALTHLESGRHFGKVCISFD